MQPLSRAGERRLNLQPYADRPMLAKPSHFTPFIHVRDSTHRAEPASCLRLQRQGERRALSLSAFPAVCPRTSYTTSLSLCFLVCCRAIIIINICGLLRRLDEIECSAQSLRTVNTEQIITFVIVIISVIAIIINFRAISAGVEGASSSSR